ncbi:MAG: hypothetical protein NT062_07020 [Proteobacteria bacterium]|nr:hypothetical protein [Pseudomonadota bacterium]
MTIIRLLFEDDSVKLDAALLTATVLRRDLTVDPIASITSGAPTT